MLDYQPNEAIALPVSIRPPQGEGVWRDLLPGVRLQPYGGTLRDTIERHDTKVPPQVRHVVGRSHILVIRPTKYLTGVRKRLRSEGTALPKGSAELVMPSSVARQCLVAAILATKSHFAVASSYSLRRRGRDWHLTGFANHQLEEASPHVSAALHSDSLDLAQTKRVAMELDRYFRAISWWTDRVGMALGYLWEGLCTPYPAQTYISLISLVDSLVGTRHSGGHALAERVAAMVGSDGKSREDAYSEMAELYSVRNKLVHGSAHPQKGKQTNLSLLMSAKASNVPEISLSALISLSVRLLKCCLADREYLSLVQRKGKESKIDEQLDALFLRRLLGVSQSQAGP